MGKPLLIYGDGLNVRDWIYVEDHSAALAAVLDLGRVGETYNIGGDQEKQNIELVGLLCDEIDRRFVSDKGLAARFPDCPAANRDRCCALITSIKDRPGHDRRYAICTKQLESELGRPTQTPLAKGLARTVDWYLANEPWWRTIQSGDYRNWIALQYGASHLKRAATRRQAPCNRETTRQSVCDRPDHAKGSEFDANS